MSERQLIELIAEKQDRGEKGRYIPNDPYAKIRPGTPVSNKELADHLLANGVRVQRWIPVTERLPEDKNTVLCTTRNGKPFVGRYNHKWKKWAVSGSVTVTDWMPLPQSQKEEK